MDGGEEERNLLTVATSAASALHRQLSRAARRVCLTTRRFVRKAGSKNGAARGGRRVAKEQRNKSNLCGWKVAPAEGREQGVFFLHVRLWLRRASVLRGYHTNPALIALFLSWPSTVNSRINT